MINEISSVLVRDVTYIKLGVQLAQRDVKAKFSDAEAITVNGGVYIISPEIGTVMSPFCPGDNSAWIYAAMFAASPYSDQTQVEEGILL